MFANSHFAPTAFGGSHFPPAISTAPVVSTALPSNRVETGSSVFLRDIQKEHKRFFIAAMLALDLLDD